MTKLERRIATILIGIIGFHLGTTTTVQADAAASLSGDDPPVQAVWLETLELSRVKTGFGLPTVAATVSGNPISLGGIAYVHGIGTHADSEITLALGGKALRFLSDVGVDDDLKCVKNMGSTIHPEVTFSVWADGKRVATSGTVGFGQKPSRLDVSLVGVQQLKLIAKKMPGTHYNHVSWGGAALVVRDGVALPPRKAVRLTSAADAVVGAVTLSSGDLNTVRAQHAEPDVVWLDALDLSFGRVDPGNLWLGGIVSRAPANAKSIRGLSTVEGKPLRMGATIYPHGLVAAGENELWVALDGTAQRFVAQVGFDHNFGCGKVNSSGKALFQVWVDGHPVVQTPMLHGYDRPVDVSVDLTGAKLLVLSAVSDGGDVLWAGAHIRLRGAASQRPVTVAPTTPEPARIARRNPEELRINGAGRLGATPGRPFLYRIPATGRPPLRFEATGLPPGLTLDPSTGVMRGAFSRGGTFKTEIVVQAANGVTRRTIAFVGGKDKLALTPPMGWNSWNAWGMDVKDAHIRAAADALIKSGLAAHGYQTVNIDEGWGGTRAVDGTFNANEKFPDMVALSSYVHDKGLRLGIHSSPGPTTCGGKLGSYQHEAQDAMLWARWGIDYLKYDWCSYGQIARDNSIAELQKPYVLMRKALDATGRDFVYSLCQYGMGDVWNWGRAIGGNLWRTGADITDTWASLSELGFTQAGRERSSGPGGWNDPDMMIVGKLGWSSDIRSTRLTQNEQVTHMTLWVMLAAPLLLGNDLTQLDSFTLDLLQNPEVNDIHQDGLGQQAGRKLVMGALEYWLRPLADGTVAVAVFNRGQIPLEASSSLNKLGIRGNPAVRNVWTRTDIGSLKSRSPLPVPPHGAILLRMGAPRI
jgi:alpha-galactosidase